MKKLRIGIIAGSARMGSYSRAVARWIVTNAPEKFEMEIIAIDNLPLYCQDSDSDIPAVYRQFREGVKSMDGFIFVTPEHNRSVPALMKNALDVGSRPWGQNAWNGKPGGVISISTGNIGGFGANHHLRQTLAFLNIYAIPQPECYLSNIGENIDDKGNVSEKLAAYLTSYINSYAEWIGKFL